MSSNGYLENSGKAAFKPAFRVLHISVWDVSSDCSLNKHQKMLSKHIFTLSRFQFGGHVRRTTIGQSSLVSEQI